MGDDCPGSDDSNIVIQLLAQSVNDHSQNLQILMVARARQIPARTRQLKGNK